MKMKNLLFSALFLGALTSCKVTQTNITATPAYAPSAEINPIRVDVDVDMTKKLSGESNSSYFLFFRTSGDNKFAQGMQYSSGSSFDKFSRVGKTKSSAAFKAVNGSGADIIVHPNYIVESQTFLFFKTIKVKVTGYAGNFTKFYQKEFCEPCTKEDVELNIQMKSK